MFSTHKNSTSTATVPSGSSSTSNNDDEFYDVIIVGAGLSGFTVAYELTRHSQTTNLKVLMLEARDRLGGRIYSIPCSGSNDHKVDLGPAWVWPSRNPHLCELLQQLHLEMYEQYLEGDHLLIRSNQQRSQRLSSNQVETGHEDSFRIVGGTYALIDALHQRLNTGNIAGTNKYSTTTTKIKLNEAVTSIEYKNNYSGPMVEVITRDTTNQDSDGNMNVEVSKSLASTGTKLYKGSYVVVTLPPQLAATTIQYQPPLSASVKQAMLKTSTWMGSAMKVALVYRKPFWRLSSDRPLSGTVMVYEPDETHPIQQYHDASSSSDDAEAGGALFGWISNDPLTQKHFRTNLTKEERQQVVIQQTSEIFGPEAINVIQYEEMDWMNSPFTSLTNKMKSSTITQQDLLDIKRSSNQYGKSELQGALYDNRLWWASTEASEQNGGFLEGAIYNGKRIAQNIIENRRKMTHNSVTKQSL